MGDPDVEAAHEEEDRRETAGAAIQRLQTELAETRARAWEGVKHRAQLAGRACRLEEELALLRAVVKRAQEAWEQYTGADPDVYGAPPELAEWMAAWDELRELDVSPTMGLTGSTEGAAHGSDADGRSSAVERPTRRRGAGGDLAAGPPHETPTMGGES